MNFARIKEEKSFFLCRCDCGRKLEVCGSSLKNGSIKSCGCSRKKDKKAKCHKNKPHWAKELCQSCYNKLYAKENGRKMRPIGTCKRCDKTKRIASVGLCQTCYCIVRKEKIKEPILASQEHKCAVKGCTTDTSNYKLSDWQLDHNHTCCKAENWCERCIRGVLCRTCNISLGRVHDSVTWLKGLVSYLKAGGK